jgi:hypothetical protein
MHVTLAGLVLFLHIGVAILAFMMAGVLHAAFPALGSARTVGEMRPWTAVVHRLEPLLPISALALLGLGAWLVHLGAHTDDNFRYSDGWIISAIVTLVVVEGLAGALLAPRAKKVVEMVAAAPDGPVPAEIHRAANDPVIWDIGHIATCSFLGVVFLMAAKPSGGWAAVFPIAGAVIGVALSRWQLRSIAAKETSAPAMANGHVPGPRTGAERAVSEH